MVATSVTVEAVRDVGPDTIALELRTPAGFDALPGQFVLIRAVPGGGDEDGDGGEDVDGGGEDGDGGEDAVEEVDTVEEGDAADAAESEAVARHYTLASPGVGETFELTVGVDPDGDLSPWLAEREPGDELHVEGPFGTITYEGDVDVVAVAGGPGVGAAVAVAEAAHEAGHGAAVVYQDDEPAHLERLERLEAAGVPVSILDVGDDEGLARAISQHVDDGQLYAFGFTDFVTVVANAIEDAGADPDEAHIENFG